MTRQNLIQTDNSNDRRNTAGNMGFVQAGVMRFVESFSYNYSSVLRIKCGAKIPRLTQTPGTLCVIKNDRQTDNIVDFFSDCTSD